MTTLLAILAMVATLDAPRYRDRELAAVRIERARSPFAGAVLWRVSRVAPPEVEHRTNAIASRWYGLTLGTLTDQDLADVDAMEAALARPEAWYVATRIAFRRGDVRRWTLRVWPLLRVRLKRIYGHEWATEIDHCDDAFIDPYTIGGILWDLHRMTTGDANPW